MLKVKTGFASIHDAQLYYEEMGVGEPMLLLHAGVADCRMWDAQFATFAQQYRAVRVDLRGFGRSAMPPGSFCNHEDVAGLLDFLQIPRAVVVGVSFGGKVAIDFALAYPPRVAALVLGAPSVGGMPPSQRIYQFWQDEEAALANEDLETAVGLNLRLWVDGLYRTPNDVHPDVRQKIGRMQREIFQMDIPEDVKELPLEPAAYGRLAEISAPTLVLVGALDLPEKLEQAAWLVSELPNAHYATIPDSAHMLNMERPQLFNQLVLDFCTKNIR